MLTETYSVVQAVLLYLIISIFVLISMHKIVYIYIYVFYIEVAMF